jgi:cytoskeletal protein RodZ
MSVRRTVAVATALVASQAVLCAVIGWVTFGGKDAAHSQPRAAEPLLGPPLVVPPVTVVPVTTPPSHHPEKADKTATSAPRHTSAPARVSASAEASPSIEALPAAPSPPATSPTVSGLVRPAATPSPSATQPDVEVGATCDPENADGLTTDGVAVRCLRDDDGNLVWQII